MIDSCTTMTSAIHSPGGYHLGRQAHEQETIRIVRTAVDNGINFFDNCWDYNGGASELRMGKALRDGYRDKAFLMTKIDGRSKESATQQIDESLRRLQTDRIDLMQFHEVIRMSDPERVFGTDGALQAVVAAQRAGKIRYVGFTGHKSPAIHLRMLDTARAHGFRFDAVQMPLNVMDAHYDSFEQQVVPRLVEQDIGVLGMKPMGDPFVLVSDTVTAVECLHYAMNLPTSVVITGCDSLPVLEQALHAARSFRPLSEAAVAALLGRTALAAHDGKSHGEPVTRGPPRRRRVRPDPGEGAALGTRRRAGRGDGPRTRGRRRHRVLERHERRRARAGDVHARRRTNRGAARDRGYRYEHREPTHVAPTARGSAEQRSLRARRSRLWQHGAG